MTKIKPVIAAAKLSKGQINPADIFRLAPQQYSTDKQKGWVFVEIKPIKKLPCRRIS